MLFRKKLRLSFDESLDAVKNAFKQEGFGVISEIDVKKTLKQKINVSFDNYRIIGFCNPNFAHNLLEIDKEFGKSLPCNVVVYQDGEDVIVSAVNPIEIVKGTENMKIREIAGQVAEFVDKAMSRL